jgi:NADPH-dependent 2,4-dienoyl-CoA reductase/sulfur reductase-like enzyme
MTVLSSSDHVIVVGAGLGGWRCVESLRREGFRGQLTLVGDEPYAPYDRPPLSKRVLAGTWDIEKTTLATPALVAANDVTMRLGVRAVSLDVATTTVVLDDGIELRGSHVVIATGARARRLAFSADDDIHALRHRDDEVRLLHHLEQLAPQSVIAVVGGGFIGAEVATQLRGRGFRPIVLEAAQRPLVSVLGDDVASWLERLAGDADIELRCGVNVLDVVSNGDRFVVKFERGDELEASAVVVGVGALANVEWLSTSGLTLDNGVVVNEQLMATDQIGAIGDVARFKWRSVSGEEQVRIEHWEVANLHAGALGHYLVTGESRDSLLVPYFWSDQYGQKIQTLGHARPSDSVHRVSGSPEEGTWVALYSRDDIVTGVIALNRPRALMLSRHLLERKTNLSDALAEVPWST